MRRPRLGSGKPRARATAEPMPKLEVPNFARALADDPTAKREIPKATYYKWISGDFPAVLRWLMRHPKALAALARDAEDIQAEENARAIRDGR